MKWITRLKLWWLKIRGLYTLSKPEYVGIMPIRKDVEVVPNPNPDQSEYTTKQVGGIEKIAPNVYILGTFELYKDGKQIPFKGISMPQIKGGENEIQ